MSRPLQRWYLTQLVLWLPGILACAWALIAGGLPLWAHHAVAAGVVFSYVLLVVCLRAGRTVADAVTLVRFIVLATLFFFATPGESLAWWSWSGLLAAVLLDLVDGWCARRFGGGEYGAVLDMETDQLATLMLALLAAGAGGGVWLLLLPLFKVLWVAAALLLGLPAHDPFPRPPGGQLPRRIFALVMTLLFVLLAPVELGLLRPVLSVGAVVALAFSFGRDFVALAVWRRRRAGGLPISTP